MHVNCSLGKGIKFVREDLKNFAKSNINTSHGIFKSVVLYNADYLTIDAQSALRRCIEIFSTNTRFFTIIENKYKLFNPILSRFCEIHIPESLETRGAVNFHKQKITEHANNTEDAGRRLIVLSKLKELNNAFASSDTNEENENALLDYSTEFYKNGVSAFDIIDVIQGPTGVDFLTEIQKTNVEFLFQKTRCEFRNETMLIHYLLVFVFMRLCVINKKCV
jgi:hypothetical protein